MQTAMREYTETVRRAHGIEMRIRVGLNSGEVVVRAMVTTCTWTTRRWDRRRIWRHAWSNWPRPGRFG